MSSDPVSSHSGRGPTGPVPDAQVFERGWLSANNILFVGEDSAVLVDSGYCTHAAQTVALVRGELGSRPLTGLANTHLHSDHCGGNASLQQHYPGVQTWIPPGMAAHVQPWNPHALSYEPTGQQCPPFRFDKLLLPDSEILLGRRFWQIHAAPGHDPHSVVLFEPQSRVLLSADALWENGFGVVFEELEGPGAFDEVAATLDLIERLAPRTVVPGHGSVFDSVTAALTRARGKLNAFSQDPRKHARHAAKVLVKFKLLELQQIQRDHLAAWTCRTPLFQQVHQRFFADATMAEWSNELVRELANTGALRENGNWIFNA